MTVTTAPPPGVSPGATGGAADVAAVFTLVAYGAVPEGDAQVAALLREAADAVERGQHDGPVVDPTTGTPVGAWRWRP